MKDAKWWAEEIVELYRTTGIEEPDCIELAKRIQRDALESAAELCRAKAHAVQGSGSMEIGGREEALLCANLIPLLMPEEP